MIPRYVDIEVPLLAELHRRGGQARPSDTDSFGDTVYEALAKHFALTADDLNEQVEEKGKQPRRKWDNMVRWARNELKKRSLLHSPKYGVWELTIAGGKYLESVNGERLAQRMTYGTEQIDANTFQRMLEEARQIGIAGERYVMAIEAKRLTEHRRPELAAQIRHVALEDVTAGYDVLSFEPDGERRLIEVKTTVSDGMSFEFTNNELQTAKRERNRYFIYRVLSVNTDRPKLVTIRDPWSKISDGSILLRPTTYMVTLGEDFQEALSQ